MIVVVSSAKSNLKGKVFIVKNENEENNFTHLKTFFECQIEMLNELNDKSSLTSISTLPDTVSWGL